ncbi:MAG: type II toxin-antitoxin system VapC family toxin [Betaproteobacteria bacterium]|nr:type II toxin-antitoxin system VapC family toxin [Betaproteobacteria bacterium]
MKYLLDTDICIYLINARPASVLNKFRRHSVGDLGISSVTASELAYGVAKSASARNRAALEDFLLTLPTLEYDLDAAMAYGQIRAALEAKGTLIGPLDLLIAAHALSRQMVLVTNNEKEFRRVPKLKVENWV